VRATLAGHLMMARTPVTGRPADRSRRYPARPVLGVGALLFRRGRVLLIERGKEPLLGYWSLPGGVVETGESLEQAVIREMREETGLDVKPSYLLEVFERVMLDNEGKAEYHYVLVDFVCRWRGGTAQASDDAQRVAWVPVQNLGQLLLTEGTRTVIERAYAAYQRRHSRIRTSA
jgi:ADP-ribose pyrophosphatase YjhB (NUDIX family)